MTTPDVFESAARANAPARPDAKTHRPTRGIQAPPSANLTQALGWMSIGAGVAQLVAPKAIARLVGADRKHAATRLLGVGGVVAGLGLLNAGGAQKTAARRRSNFGNAASRLSAAVTINRTPEQCYGYWRDIEKLPTFLTHLKSVRVTDDRRSHWIARGPGDKDLAWDAEITEDAPNQQIAWRSLPGSCVPNSGSVRFEPARGGRGTIVRVRMQYELPAEAGGPLLQALAGRDPGLRVRKSLLRFKQLLETGEIATTEGQPAGRPQSTTWTDRMARI